MHKRVPSESPALARAYRRRGADGWRRFGELEVEMDDRTSSSRGNRLENGKERSFLSSTRLLPSATRPTDPEFVTR